MCISSSGFGGRGGAGGSGPADTWSSRTVPMHDIKWIRENPEAFDAGLTKRG